MKIKVKAEDFQVREQAGVQLSQEPGAYAVYRLAKRHWDTFDLVDYLARRLRVGRGEISFGGIKDRFGQTEQLVSIRTRPELPRALAEMGFSLSLAGYLSFPIGAGHVRGNRFLITLRDLRPRELLHVEESLPALQAGGVPNYYDQQRFGSARHGGGFMGKEIFLGRREQALRLYFQPSGQDRRKTRALKACVSENWGKWERCLPLAFGEYRRLLLYLREHRRAFHGALALIDRRFLRFVIGSYQSFLFNQVLSLYLKSLQGEHGFALLRYPYRWGEFLFPASLPEGLLARLRGSSLPVPGHDSSLSDPSVRALVERVLEAEGVELSQLRVRQLSGLRLHGLQRSVLLLPEGLQARGPEPDELYPGRRKLTLQFSLPRGGYATLVVKRLQAQRLQARP
jgi:tRNA pseudouridine13 synthase